MLRRAVHILGTSKAGRSPQVLGGTLASLTGGCGAGTGEATLFRSFCRTEGPRGS